MRAEHRGLADVRLPPLARHRSPRRFPRNGSSLEWSALQRGIIPESQTPIECMCGIRVVFVFSSSVQDQSRESRLIRISIIQDGGQLVVRNRFLCAALV